MIHNLLIDPDCQCNLNTFFLGHGQPLRKILSKSIRNSSSELTELSLEQSFLHCFIVCFQQK